MQFATVGFCCGLKSTNLVKVAAQNSTQRENASKIAEYYKLK